MSPKQTDVGARLSELEATVRGLTQELVEANERIRTLEAELEGKGAKTAATDGSGVRSPTSRNGSSGPEDGENSSGTSTKHTKDDRQADEEAGSDLDDIIVA